MNLIGKLALFLILLSPMGVCFGSSQEGRVPVEASLSLVIAAEALSEALAENDATHARSLERYQAVVAVPIVGPSTQQYRRIAEPPFQPRVETSPGYPVLPAVVPEPLEYRSFKVVAHRFDGAFSFMTVEKEGEVFELVSRMNFEFMPLLGSFQTSAAQYSFMFIPGMPEQALQESRSSAGENETDALIRKAFETNPEADFFFFDHQSAILGSLYQEVEALHAFYSQNEQALKAERLNQRAMAKARAQVSKTAPRPDLPTRVNFWPIQSRTGGVKPERWAVQTSTED